MKIIVRELALDAGETRRQLCAAFPDLHLVFADDDAALWREIADADAVIGGRIWNAEVFAGAPRLRWVQSVVAGVDHLALDDFARHGVTLTTFRGTSSPNIAEHVAALMLAFARGLPDFIRRQSQATWMPRTQRPRLFELRGQRVGIIGLGDLGCAIAATCHALGMEVWAVLRTPRDLPPGVTHAVNLDQLTYLLRSIDHLVLALPATPQTRKLIDRAALAHLKHGAYVYNVGRGDSLDYAALAEALMDKRLGGAGLDVTDPEPLPSDSPLWALPNVIITGHSAGASPQRWVRGMELLIDNIARFCAGQTLRNVLTLPSLTSNPDPLP